MKTSIIVSTEFTGKHRWPGAPDRRDYLRDAHTHRFLITVAIPVRHDDRDLEFHDVQATLEMIRLTELGGATDGRIIDLGTKSCEQIAKQVGLSLAAKGIFAEVIQVWEDTCGGRVEWTVPDWEETKDPRRVKPRVVTVCGSTRFKDALLRALKDEELVGNAVFSVGSLMHADGIPFSEETKQELDLLHKRKIAMSDEILVLNVGGYIGQSTASEIWYAKELGLRLRFIEDAVWDGETFIGEWGREQDCVE